MSTLKVGEIKHENFTGTTQLKLDSAGRVLIGTTSSITTDSNAHSRLQLVTSAGGNFAIARNDTDVDDNDRLGVFNFASNHGGTYHEVVTIRAAADADHASNSKASRLELYTTGTGNTQSTERMRIDSSGRLLLGTTTEGHTSGDDLTIATSGTTGITLRSGTSDGGRLFFSDGTSGADEYRGVVGYDHNTNHMYFSTDASERLRIDSAGRVGIGTTSPSSFDSSADDLVINGSGNTGITINSGATSSTSEGNLVFAEGNGSGGSADEWRGAIQYKHGDDRMSFYTDNTERLRVTTSGIFPVANGQTFNSSQLPNGNSFQINTTSSSHGLSVTRYSTNYAGYALNIGRSKSNTIGTNSLVGNTDDLGHITWYGADGTDFNQAAMISALVDGTPSGGEDMPGALAFKTTPEGSGSPQSRMWIASNGRVAIGTSLGTNAAGKFQVVEESGSGDDNDCNAYFETNRSDWNIKTYYNRTGTHYHIVFIEQGTERGGIYGADGSNVNYNQGSDYRWKENIVEITGTEGIEICKKLKPSKYNWIANREATGEINTVDGFIAHEVEEAGVLGAVSGEKDAVNEDGSIKGQQLDYGQMTPVLSAAIKGLIAKVEALETKVAVLEAA